MKNIKSSVSMATFISILLLTNGCGSMQEELPTTVPTMANTLIPTNTLTSTFTITPSQTATPTQTPTASPTITPTFTPTPLPKFVANTSLPLLAGPNIQYSQTGSLKKGEEYFIIGQDNDCKWLQVSDQQEITGWLRNEGNAVELQIPCTNLLPGTYRPPTGLLISVQGTRGWNQIRIDNGEELDAVFILTDSYDQLIVSSYVRNGEKFTMSKIYDDRYYLYFTTGTDWNGTVFTKDASYHRYEDALNFYTTGATEKTNWYYTYMAYTITLPAEKGKTIEILADQFPKPYP